MVGIVTAPVPPPPDQGPAVILLNAGVIHRVGANRIYVRVARALAQAGYPVFRFDFSGIGDSEARQDVLDLDEALRLDIADALAHMESSQNARSFVIFGLCSGANNGFRYAIRDERVTAVVLIDPVAFRTLGHQLRFFGRRLLRPRVWWNVVRGRNAFVRDFLRRLRGQSDLEQEMENAYPVGPGRDEMRKGLRTLIDRQVEMLVVYTGGLEWQYNYREQFRDMFPDEAASARIRVEFLEDSDHTFSAEAHKAWLVNLATSWMASVVSKGDGAPQPVAVSKGS
jgi:pimeloyl-ACP methyl ester carboxylesterase